MSQPFAINNNILYATIGVLVAFFVGIIGFLYKFTTDESRSLERAEEVRQMLGNEQRRPRQRHVSEDEEDEDANESNEDDEDATKFSTKPMGKKKLAKLQAKADARAAREAELVAREERKARELEKEKEREVVRKAEEEAEEKRKQEELQARKEREEKELEEYLKLKQAFSVEEEGFEAKSEEEKENLMQQFVDYVKKVKSVNIDELAAHFALDPEVAVERLQFFMDNEILTGVMDDRGKFIYISEKDFAAVAKFINQRGRFSLSELANYSNDLICMTGE